jgi:curved DNA-binding protein CbpA
MDAKNYYKLLSVKQNDSLEEIKESFQKLAELFRPDKRDVVIVDLTNSPKLS